jgi:hypothetical protein
MSAHVDKRQILYPLRISIDCKTFARIFAVGWLLVTASGGRCNIRVKCEVITGLGMVLLGSWNPGLDVVALGALLG